MHGEFPNQATYGETYSRENEKDVKIMVKKTKDIKWEERKEKRNMKTEGAELACWTGLECLTQGTEVEQRQPDRNTGPNAASCFLEGFRPFSGYSFQVSQIQATLLDSLLRGWVENVGPIFKGQVTNADGSQMMVTPWVVLQGLSSKRCSHPLGGP